jgi:hypothetical protein
MKGDKTMDEKDVSEFYANGVNVITSIYDVVLNFRTEYPISVKPGEKPIMEASGTCRVRMSPQHAKSLAALLIEHLDRYERDHNLTLPLPPNIKEMWDTHVKKKGE